MSSTRDYIVTLTRVDPSAGGTAHFHATVRAPDQTTAKRSAEGQYPGYRATGVRLG